MRRRPRRFLRALFQLAFEPFDALVALAKFNLQLERQHARLFVLDLFILEREFGFHAVDVARGRVDRRSLLLRRGCGTAGEVRPRHRVAKCDEAVETSEINHHHDSPD